MGILSGIFKARDKPSNATAGSAYHFLFGSSTSGKAVTECSAMVGFVTKERVDGNPILPEAVQVLQMGA